MVRKTSALMALSACRSALPPPPAHVTMFRSAGKNSPAKNEKPTPAPIRRPRCRPRSQCWINWVLGHLVSINPKN
jgi:hypothetical protein